DTLIGSIMDGQVGRRVPQVVVAQVKRDQTDVIIVQVNGIELTLPDVAGHSLADRSIQLDAQLRVRRVDGAGVGPTQLPLVPKIDHLVPIGENVLINLEGKSIPFDGHRQVQVES